MDLKAYCSIIRVSTPYTPYIVAFLKITTVIFSRKSQQRCITKPFSGNFKIFYVQIIRLFCGVSAYISQIYMQILHEPTLSLHTPMTPATRRRFYHIGIYANIQYDTTTRLPSCPYSTSTPSNRPCAAPLRAVDS